MGLTATPGVIDDMVVRIPLSKLSRALLQVHTSTQSVESGDILSRDNS